MRCDTLSMYPLISKRLWYFMKILYYTNNFDKSFRHQKKLKLKYDYKVKIIIWTQYLARGRAVIKLSTFYGENNKNIGTSYNGRIQVFNEPVLCMYILIYF